MLGRVMKVEVHLWEFLMWIVTFTNGLPYRSRRGSQYPSTGGRVGPWTGLNALEKSLMPTLGTNYMFISHFGWGPTWELTTLKTEGWGVIEEIVLKAGIILYLESSHFTCEHVARALVENTVIRREFVPESHSLAET